MSTSADSPDAAHWKVKPPFGARTLAIGFCILFLLGISAKRMDLDTLVVEMGNFAASTIGIKEQSQVGDSLDRLLSEMFPITLAERTPVSRITDFDPDRLPPFSHIETSQTEVSRINPETLRIETKLQEETWLVEPLGYLFNLSGKMLETFEIAIWATLFAVLASLPLAVLASKNYSPHGLIYFATRSLISFFRAIPEIISALFMVLAFGFGPIAGILALGLHGIGFLGKFYAEEIEDADQKPQEALSALGAGPLTVLRLAVWPQILPGFTALSIYILDRNVRMATVVGLVGAGGIGQELKGRYDLFEYDRVGTSLALIFAAILILDFLAAQLRKRMT